MSNNILQIILDIPIFWRAFFVFFILWLLYVIFSRGIFKLLAAMVLLVSKIWFLFYVLFNNLMHIMHKLFGKSLINADQATTNFFGSVYKSIYKIKSIIEGTYVKKSPIYNINGNQMLDKNGIPQYSHTPKKPFIGYALILFSLLVLWISFPVWLHIEDSNNFFSIAYCKYIEIETKVLEMIFLGR